MVHLDLGLAAWSQKVRLHGTSSAVQHPFHDNFLPQRLLFSFSGPANRLGQPERCVY